MRSVVEAVAKTALAEGGRATKLSLVITGLRMLIFWGVPNWSTLATLMGVELAAVAVEEVKRV